MRIAILSDVHGNTLALETVLADVAAQGDVDAFWVLGDLAAMGFDPAGAVERVRKLKNVRFVRGNTDRWLTEEMESYGADETNPEQFKRLLNMTRIFAWTQGVLMQAGQLDFFDTLPLDFRTALPDGTRVLCVHASPGNDDGAGFHPRYQDDAMLARMENANADLIFVGHTHHAMNRLLGDVHLVNIGAVTIYPPNDMRAKYVMLDADENGYTIEHRYLATDHDAMRQAIEAVRFPSSTYLTKLYTAGNTAFPLSDSFPEPFIKLPRPKL